jgi:hypothetical protein
MSSSRVDAFAELFGESSQEQEEVFETGGIVFPDGHCIEVVRHKRGNLRLLDSRRKRAKESIRAAGRTYVPLNLHNSILEALTLPMGRAPSGSTADLFKAIRDLFVAHGISDPAAKLLAYFAASTWFPRISPRGPELGDHRIPSRVKNFA